MTEQLPPPRLHPATRYAPRQRVRTANRDVFVAVALDSLANALGLGEPIAVRTVRRILAVLVVASAFASAVSTASDAGADASWTRAAEVAVGTALPLAAFAALAVIPTICHDLGSGVPTLIGARPLGVALGVLAQLAGGVAATAALLVLSVFVAAAIDLHGGVTAMATLGSAGAGVLVSLLLAAALTGWAGLIAAYFRRPVLALGEYAVVLALLGSLHAAFAAQAWLTLLLTPFGQVQLVIAPPNGSPHLVAQALGVGALAAGAALHLVVVSAYRRAAAHR